jgi:hypothetical protein
MKLQFVKGRYLKNGGEMTEKEPWGKERGRKKAYFADFAGNLNGYLFI